MEFLDYSDNGGESFGDGLSFDQLGYTGALDDMTETPLQGSAVSLNPSSALDDISIADQPSGLDAWSLSGNSEASPDPFNNISLEDAYDTQIGGANGAGIAAPTSLHPVASISAHDTTAFMSGLTKFGSVIGSLFGKQGAGVAAPVIRGPVANANPYRTAPATPVSFNLALIIVVIVALLVFAIATGGKT